jgi:hypothetical protein
MWHQPSDDSVSRHLLRAAEANWRFVFAQFPAVDGYTHQSGHDSPPVHRALRRVDSTVGKLRQILRRKRELDQSLILLVSDHGASPVHTHLDLADWFRARGVPTLAHPVIWEPNPRAAVMVAGNGSAMVYARPGQPREHRWPVERLMEPATFDARTDVLTALIREPAVAFLAAESERGGLWLGGRAGQARLWARGDKLTYQPISGDPLEVGGAWSGTSRDWLEKTRDGAFPDGPFHLLDQFRSNRSGDLLVVGREGYDFRGRFEIPEHRSGHGSMIRVHMQTPVWANQPVPACALRTVDLFPAMLDWLGTDIPDEIDGAPVWLPGSRKPGRAGRRRIAVSA